jgi:UDP-GlcNAc:undecaprenyl-phosphate GlcNAc-1-phosphate transferase
LDYILTYGVLFVISACASFVLTPFVGRLAVRIGVVDRPGERKIHTASVPRLGGVSLVLSIFLTVLVALGLQRVTGRVFALDLEAWGPVLYGGMIVFLVGIWDDVRSIPAWVKFLFQAMATCLVLWFGVQIDQVSLLGGDSLKLGVLGPPLTFLWIIGITNAFNLLDGLDGLAVGLASIVAGSCATIFFLRGDAQDTLLLVILIGALLGFLPYNFNPARIFLGDSGSLVVGYVLAVTAITGSQKGATTLAVVIPLLVFGLPIVDTLLSMTRRFVASRRLLKSSRARLKERILCVKHMFEADQKHIHHRLLALGFSHRNAVLLLYALALGLSSLAFFSVLAQYRNAGIILLAVGLATYIGVRKLGYDEIAFLRTGTLLRWYEQVTFKGPFFTGFVDMVLISLAYWGAFFLKYETPWPGDLVTWYRNAFPFVLVTQLVGFHVLGVYRGVWQAVGVSDLIRLSLTIFPTVALSYALALIDVPPQGTFSFFWIDALCLGTIMVGTRSIYRVLDYVQQRENAAGDAVLIYGAGRGGQLVLRELLQNPRLGLRPVGFLDDDAFLHGRMVNQVPVLGSGDELKSVLDNQQVSCLIVSSPQIKAYRLRRAIDVCHTRDIPVLQGSIQLIPIGTNGALRSILSKQPDVKH